MATSHPPYYIALQAQLDNLGSRMENSFNEIKVMLSGYDVRLRDLEKSNIQVETTTGISMNAAWKRLDEHTDKLIRIEDDIGALKESSKRLNEIFKWLLGIFTVVFTGALMLFISGKATIIFK